MLQHNTKARGKLSSVDNHGFKTRAPPLLPFSILLPANCEMEEEGSRGMKTVATLACSRTMGKGSSLLQTCGGRERPSLYDDCGEVHQSSRCCFFLLIFGPYFK